MLTKMFFNGKLFFFIYIKNGGLGLLTSVVIVLFSESTTASIIEKWKLWKCRRRLQGCIDRPRLAMLKPELLGKDRQEAVRGILTYGNRRTFTKAIRMKKYGKLHPKDSTRIKAYLLQMMVSIFVRYLNFFCRLVLKEIDIFVLHIRVCH